MPTRPRRPILRVLAIVLAVALVLVLGGFAWRFVTTRLGVEPSVFGKSLPAGIPPR